MQMTHDAKERLDATVRRVLGSRHVPEPQRAGVRYELTSHLHAAAEDKAKVAGRSEIVAADLDAALAEMGGEEELARAFVDPVARPPKRAGVVERTVAFLIDAVIIFVGMALVAFALFVVLAPLWLFGVSPGAFRPPMMGFPEAMFGFPFPFPFLFPFALVGLIGLAYFTYLEGSRGTTVGKKVFDLRVLREDGKPVTYGEALLRNVVKVFFLLLVLDALLMVIFFQKEKQRASDKLAGTIVVEER